MKNIKQKKCENCKGKGCVPMYFMGQLARGLKECPVCKGTGKIETEIKEKMTKEELKTDESKCIIELVIKDKLKKEAEEYAKKDCPDNFLCTRDIARRGYLAGAVPREKHIVELEAQIEKMNCCENCRFRNRYNDADFKKEKCISCCPETDNWEFME